MNGFTAVILGVCCVFADAAAPVEGLILHWPLDGDARDATHLQNHGQVAGAALAENRFGEPNSAFRFNGTGAFIEGAAPLPESESLTISMWFALDSWVQLQNPGVPHIMFFEGDDGSGRDVVIYTLGGIHFGVKSNEGLNYYNWLPPLGVWTHLICVADAPQRKLSMWINGAKVAEKEFSGGANIGAHAPVNLGRRPGSYNDWFFAGAIDQVRVYDRALSELEIASLHAAERGNAGEMSIEIETLRLTFGVIPGDRYILQSSADLLSWSDYGAPFQATAAEHTASVQAVGQGTFWRVLSSPTN